MPFVQIRAVGGVYAKFGVTKQYDSAALNKMTFCTGASQECTCPAGDVSTVPQTEPLPSEPDLGLAVGSEAGEVQITYLPLSTYCQPATCPSASQAESLPRGGQPSDGADKCPNHPGSADGGHSSVDGSTEGGRGGDGGDPHMIGFGSGAYDFQGAGEYTVVKATRGDFQIQAISSRTPDHDRLPLTRRLRSGPAGRRSSSTRGRRRGPPTGFNPGLPCMSTSIESARRACLCPAAGVCTSSVMA
jgi:hypothetical protein